MAKYRIIGCMTGNSMDAVDLVLTEFDGKKMKDVCSFSKPFLPEIQLKIENLRHLVFNKTKDEILVLPDFKNIHHTYIQFVADAINEMCRKYGLDKARIDAIGFHGKTLDHYPPSKAVQEGGKPYTLQIGSGKMLADLTGIKVVYDFRSNFIMKGFEGAPLVGEHNAHVAQTEGDGIYYNGGNTANFAVVEKGQVLLSTDAGPFNEYIDAFVRKYTSDTCDFNGKYGLKGKLDQTLLQKFFDIGRVFYETKLPKSGDPQYYKKKEVFEEIEKSSTAFEDAVYTLEYFAAYIAAFSLAMIDEKIKIMPDIVLFGGGWKNPIVRQSFEKLLCADGYVLSEHRLAFEHLLKRFEHMPIIRYSAFGEMMEARLMADMAYFKLENKPWTLPEVKNIVAGRIALPNSGEYDDMVNLAAKGF